MPLQATSGAASYDAFGGGAAAVPQYIEDVFSTYLYTGNSSTQTITNGIDLAGKGGLVWIKNRNLAGEYHYLWDTVRGNTKSLSTNLTDAQANYTGISSFNSNGFTEAIGYSSASNLASWTFRKQPKFFDVLTYSGTGVAGRTVAHSLGSVPACMIVKRTDAAGGWYVYHTSLGATKNLQLSSTGAALTRTQIWNDTAPTSTVFSLGTDTDVNGSGGTYVAYLFASNAGGFGLTGTDNVISCGSYTGNGSATGPVVTLGYEPQWVLVKRATVSTGNWILMDNMRGLNVSTGGLGLYANTTDGEGTIGTLGLSPSATGFYVTETSSALNASGSSYIYIAIRRGPMKVPTTGTSVFYPLARTGNNTLTNLTGFGFPPDIAWTNRRDGAAGFTSDKLRGPPKYLTSQTTAAEATYAAGSGVITFNQDGVTIGTDNSWNAGTPIANWFFKRAPSFMDAVAYSGTGSGGAACSHNLGVAPELIIVKKRSAASSIGWLVLNGFGVSSANYLSLNTTTANTGIPYSSSTILTGAPTSTSIPFNGYTDVNATGQTYVAYLFATLAGVSKVGTYTGNGTTQTIDCGLTAGARFVLIKCTSTTGDWFVYDTARGMTTLTDPYLLLNSSAAEAATLGSVTTVATGFAVNDAILTGINTNAATYIFLAVG